MNPNQHEPWGCVDSSTSHGLFSKSLGWEYRVHPRRGARSSGLDRSVESERISHPLKISPSLSHTTTIDLLKTLIPVQLAMAEREREVEHCCVLWGAMEDSDQGGAGPGTHKHKVTGGSSSYMNLILSSIDCVLFMRMWGIGRAGLRCLDIGVVRMSRMVRVCLGRRGLVCSLLLCFVFACYPVAWMFHDGVDVEQCRMWGVWCGVVWLVCAVCLLPHPSQCRLQTGPGVQFAPERMVHLRIAASDNPTHPHAVDMYTCSEEGDAMNTMWR